MCGAHRLAALKQIRARLAETEAKQTRIVSTSLIEAGVDLDVPVVYRAAAGFDSIAQAAGRCNREGLRERGFVYVFDAEDIPPAGIQRDGAQIAHELWGYYEDDLLSPKAAEHYFRNLYWKKKDRWDRRNVLDCVRLEGQKGNELHFQFREMAERYRLIPDEDQVHIVVPYDEKARSLIEELRSPWVDFVSHRRLQPYLVSVPKRSASALSRNAVIEHHPSGVSILVREDVYTQDMGLDLEKAGVDDRVLIA
jgi:CRISPR-associated endonuclease/helicase Cas3